jgi:hypothetical protein
VASRRLDGVVDQTAKAEINNKNKKQRKKEKQQP